MIRLPLVVFAFAVFITQVASASDIRAEEKRDRLVQVNVSPTFLSFGAVQSGSSVTRSEQLVNTGRLPMFVFATAVPGAAFDFDCAHLPLELKPRSKLSCNVGFRPQRPAKYAGTIIVWFKWRDQDDSRQEPLDDATRARSFERRERWKSEERACVAEKMIWTMEPKSTCPSSDVLESILLAANSYASPAKSPTAAHRPVLQPCRLQNLVHGPNGTVVSGLGISRVPPEPLPGSPRTGQPAQQYFWGNDEVDYSAPQASRTAALAAVDELH
jgi:hypothetical protein